MYHAAFIRMHQWTDDFLSKRNPCAYCGKKSKKNIWHPFTSGLDSPSNRNNPNSLLVCLCKKCSLSPSWDDPAWDGPASDDTVEVVLAFAQCWLEEHPEIVPTNEPREAPDPSFPCAALFKMPDFLRYRRWMWDRRFMLQRWDSLKEELPRDEVPVVLSGEPNSGGPGFVALYHRTAHFHGMHPCVKEGCTIPEDFDWRSDDAERIAYT